MSENVNVLIRASMSKDRLQEFLQNLRDFDMKHDAEIPFQIVVNSPTMKEAEIKAIYESIRPPMPYMGRIDHDGRLAWKTEKKGN